MSADYQPESQEEILAACEASLTEDDIPPEDEAFGWPDPDTGAPPELESLSDAELAELLDAAPAQHVPPTWPLSYLAPDEPGSPPWPGGFPQRDGADDGNGFAEGGVLDELPASMALAGFADDAYTRVGRLDDNAQIGVLRAWRRLTSWAQARELAMVVELARRRPAPGTPPAGPGQFPAQPSEFVADEVGLALTLTGMAARTEVDLALDLASRPAIAAALEAGRIDLPRCRILLSMICPLAPAHADAVEAAVLPRAGELTTGELRAALQRAVLAVDPEAARRRREEAQKNARVEHWADPEGTATLAGRYLPPAEVLAADKRLCAIATAWKKQGAQGGMDLLRAHVYLALLLGQDIGTPPPSLMLPAEPSTPTYPTAGPPRPAGDHQPGRTTPGKAGDPATDQDGITRQNKAGHDTTGQNPAGHGTLGPNTTDQNPAGYRTPGQSTAGQNPAGYGTAGQSAAGHSTAGHSTAGQGPRRPDADRPLPPMTGSVNLTVPLSTLLGLADRPGEAAGYGPLHADTTRAIADAMAGHRGTRWGVIVTDIAGRAMGYGGSVPARPISAGGWKITLTTEPIAPYP